LKKSQNPSTMQLTTLTLNIPLHPGNIPAFRGSIVELLGREYHLFHNHDNSQGKDHFHWGYPLVQYGVRRGKATIIGMNEGSDAINQVLWPRLSNQLSIAGREYELRDKGIGSQQIEINWQTQPQRYGLSGWLALNKDNYQLWKTTKDEDIRRTVLNQALTGHLRCLAGALQLPEPKRAIGEVLHIDNQKKVHWKNGLQLISFDVLIQCNLNLMPGLGLGRLAAFGYGEMMSEDYYRAYRNSKRGVMAYEM